MTKKGLVGFGVVPIELNMLMHRGRTKPIRRAAQRRLREMAASDGPFRAEAAEYILAFDREVQRALAAMRGR